MFVLYNVLSINTIVILSIFNYLRKFDGRVLYIPIAEARGFTTHWISKISTHRVEILQYLNYFLNLYFPFPCPDTGSIISACTKLERCFEAPDDHCFHQIIIACKRRFIIYNLCKKICDIFTRFPIKNLFLSWDNLP